MVAVSLLVNLLFFGAASAVAAVPRSTPSTVLTPRGNYPAENVHEVPQGGEVRVVGSEIQVLDPAGNVIHSAPAASGDTNTSPVEPIASGWIAYASWYNEGSPITYFTTTWSVPPAPASYYGQTVFYFNSIEPGTYDAILQPVLQYGPSAAGGGGYWSIASWYVTSSNAYFTTLVTVNVGDVLDGLMTLTSSSGSSFNYASSFSNVAGTTLNITNIAELVWATETLEVYNVDGLDELPPSPFVFEDIDIATATGPAGVQWSAVSDPDDGITTTVTVNSGTDGVITITY